MRKKAELKAVEPVEPEVDAQFVEEAQIGHNVNKGEFNETLARMFEEFEALDENKRQISKAQADIKAKAKEQFGVHKKIFSTEIAMRKLDKAVRIQFEQQHHDLKYMLGYQMALSLEAPLEDFGADPEEAAHRLSK